MSLLSEAKEATGVRAITRGPKFPWFGYYDKFQFDPTWRAPLGLSADMVHPTDYGHVIIAENLTKEIIT